MKRNSPSDKLAKKRALLLERTAAALEVTPGDAERLLSTEREQSIRLNPLRTAPSSTLDELRRLGWHGAPYEWAPDCYSADGKLDEIKNSGLASNGSLYIQNAASWIPVTVLDPQSHERVLDVCAAPGGKTTHIAAASGGTAQITANDNSRARLMKLQAVCAQLNAPIERFTLFDARALGRKLAGESFDKILLDAPCSGEGMMRYDSDKDFATWSVAQIKRLQTVQKRILTQAWQLLKPGGTLVYSTCTIAPEENEAVISYALRTLDDVTILPIDLMLDNRTNPVKTWNSKVFQPEVQACLRLKPSSSIEAFFVAKLHKKQ